MDYCLTLIMKTSMIINTSPFSAIRLHMLAKCTEGPKFAWHADINCFQMGDVAGMSLC